MLRLVVVDEVVATVVIHIDHIQIGPSKEVAGAAMHFLIDKQSTVLVSFRGIWSVSSRGIGTKGVWRIRRLD